MLRNMRYDRAMGNTKMVLPNDNWSVFVTSQHIRLMQVHSNGIIHAAIVSTLIAHMCIYSIIGKSFYYSNVRFAFAIRWKKVKNPTSKCINLIETLFVLVQKNAFH